MSETIEKGAAMTAAHIQKRCAAIAALIGGSEADCTILVKGSGVSALVTHSAGSSGYEHFSGPTLGAVLKAAEKFAATFAPLRKEKAVRKLALDIIDLSDQHGKCTVAMLRGRSHSQQDIDTYRDAACVRAGEMSGNAPFEVSA